jgi:hypothetical protein
VALLLALLACSPNPATPTPASIQLSTAVITDTPSAPQPTSQASDNSCDWDLFPTDAGATWDYVGSSNTQSSYQRTDVITESGDGGFTVTSSLPDKTLILEYGCTEEGLIQLDPAQSYGGGMAVGQSGAAAMHTLNQSGISLPADWEKGDTWQQDVEWEAVGGGNTIQGVYHFESSDEGEESVTVPYGTFDATLVQTALTGTIQGQPFPPCQISTWWVEDVGMAKQVFSCGNGSLNNTVELEDFVAP